MLWTDIVAGTAPGGYTLYLNAAFTLVLPARVWVGSPGGGPDVGDAGGAGGSEAPKPTCRTHWYRR
jgi:hypothetical protein